jgi:hypothetical protein
MEHRPSLYRYNGVGTLVLDGSETTDEIIAAFDAERARVDAVERADWSEQRLLSLAGHRPAVPPYEPRKWPGYALHSARMWKRPRRRRNPAGDGTLRHEERVRWAKKLCRQHRVEFWALAPRGGIWAVRDREYWYIDNRGVTLRKADAIHGLEGAA